MQTWEAIQDCNMTGRAERSGSELALMARLTTPLWLITPGGRTVWLNTSARSMVGLAPEQAPDRLAAHMAGTTLPRAEPILFRLGNRETVVPCRLYQTDNHLLAEADPVSGRDQPDLIHHLSHELRTPLNAIIGFVRRREKVLPGRHEERAP
jgi:signal transduction histidine kinase